MHVLENRLVAVIKPFLGQKIGHHTISRDTVMKMIQFTYSPENHRFGFPGFCFSVFQVVVICVGIYIEALEQPPQAEFFVVVFYKLVFT